MRLALLLLVLLAACEKREKKPPVRREIEGTLSLDGKPLEMTQCRTGRGVTTYVELVTAQGKLRFEDKQMFWDDAKLECDKLERSWGGGQRQDGTSYFRGHLIFVCKGPPGAVTGDVTVDCGAITKEERDSLDKNRQDMLDEQQRAKGSANQ